MIEVRKLRPEVGFEPTTSALLIQLSPNWATLVNIFSIPEKNTVHRGQDFNNNNNNNNHNNNNNSNNNNDDINNNMTVTLTIILSLLNVVTTMLHILGCYLLTCQYNYGEQNPQQLYLINLSISEGLFLFFWSLFFHKSVIFSPPPICLVYVAVNIDNTRFLVLMINSRG